MGLLFIKNKELRLVGIWTPIGHAQATAAVMRVVGMKFVGKCYLVAPDGGFISSHMGRIAPLSHEALNIAVEDGAIVLSSGGQGEEIKGSPRAGVAKDLAFDVADRSVDSDRHEECRKLLT